MDELSESFGKCSLNKNVQKLKEHLELLHIDHNTNILNECSLKNAHIYCVIHNISSQQFGPLLEKYIIEKFNYKKNNSSDCIGDCSKKEENFEIKTSLGGSKHIKFNFVQIRLFQNIHNYILTAYYLDSKNVEEEGELFIFKIDKDSIKKLIIEYGGYAHGTKKENGEITDDSINDETKIKEYALRTSFNDKCWNELLKFRILEEDL
jgi:hypothetical protein